MLVYGDRGRCEDPRDMLARLSAMRSRLAGAPAGLARQAALAGLLIEAGALLQGIADAERAGRGVDDASPAQEAVAALLLGLARALHAAWHGAAAPLPEIPRLPDLPERVETRLAEGFAFYALYPETYALAAAASGLPPATRVLGLRSIGAPLGAMVAAGLGAAAPVTLRPVGHPFRRELAVAPDLAARLAGDAPVAVVDEGPGLSGSSFGATADWLEARGVPPGRIAFFPSHGNPPGAMADPRHRARWEGAARHCYAFEAAVQPRLADWAADLVGPAEGPLQDVSGGAWRGRRQAVGADWPPAHPAQERRKYLLPAGGRTWLLKFAGLGAEGERKAERARRLAEAGFAPPVAGWRHGFLVQRWLVEARPLDPAQTDRDRLAARVGAYLEFRAHAFPAAPDRGAGPAELHAMARHNTAAALGEDAARGLDRWTPGELATLARRARPVETDNRLQAWEWLLLPDGRLLKADAVDHHAAHDLIGCQDIAWDVAGAMVELGIRPEVEADPALLEFLLPCYCAFQLGAWSMALDAAPDAAEAARLRGTVDRYAARLREALGR
ncbi:hypothetical protein [Paracraurococcus lichenis]|uniref:Uncharacterized protein n=1 Tax=Paracraurococcus lichenis TaxID=3064888 RepID=A0ABT9E755_9PROT|nr:hypothetical protein [Paracraurococcus sp. LOR1-02]MDO9712009.1 hypothetical protein [Paracraurococcus sp. LOR1-02]